MTLIEKKYKLCKYLGFVKSALDFIGESVLLGFKKVKML